MSHPLWRAAVWSAPAALAYTVLLPVLALSADRRLGLAWPLPPLVSGLAFACIPAGALLALWCVAVFAAKGAGTPNPMAPPARLVVAGPYRYCRNPMMLGGWLAGAGLTLLLRSPALAAGIVAVIAAGSVYVRLIEEPKLAARFGPAWTEYAAAVPRWLPRCPVHALSHHAPGR